MINGLDLFSGIGGLSLALAPWIRPIAYCEIDRYAQSVLLSRMVDGQLSVAPIWDDVQTLGRLQFDVPVDAIYGGFPCQDISTAGLGKGLAGERSSLFFEIARLCRELEPRFVFLENVPAITIRGGAEVVRIFTSMGYDCRWCTLSAASIGAIHKRDRWWLLAYTKSERIVSNRPIEFRDLEKVLRTEREDAINFLLDGSLFQQKTNIESLCSDYGVPEELDAFRSYGNAVVPKQAREAFKVLMFGEGGVEA